MKPLRVVLHIAALAVVMVTLSAGSCFDGSPTAPTKSLTGEAYCAQVSTAYGHNFFCGSPQANLNNDPNMPAGYLGYCMPTQSNLGLVGYSAHTFSGGAFLVTDQSSASAYCTLLGNQCSGYSRCTRQ